MPRTVGLRRVLWGGVALGLVFFLALTLWLALSAIFFPYQLDYGEGDVLLFTRELALGHPIYKGLEGLPYASSNYPPMAMLLATAFRPLFGDTYYGGRWLNFAAALLIAAFVYRFVREETGPAPRGFPLNRESPNKAAGPRSAVVGMEGGERESGGRVLAAALSALFFLGSTFVYHWVPLFRVDLIGLAFTVGGIFFVRRWQFKKPALRLSKGLKPQVKGDERFYAVNLQPASWDLGLAALFFLAAIYSKHSLLSAPAAAVVAIALCNRRAAAGFALALGVSGGAIFLAVDALTRGGLTFGLITSNATVWQWNTFLSLTGDFLWTYLVLIAFALSGWVSRVRARRVGILEIYALAATASLAFAGRIGAWENYYLEAIVIICVFAGIVFAPLLKRGLAGPVWLPVLLLIQLVLFWPEHDPAIARELLDGTRAGYEQVAPIVRAQQGTVIVEDMGLLVMNGKPVDYYSFQYSSLARSGKWDQHWELENLSAGNFPLVILDQGTREDVDRHSNFTREFVSALDYNYGLSLENARYKVYKPAPLAHLRGDNFDGQLELKGWSLAPGGNARAGQALTLTVVWRAEKQLSVRYTAFAHIEDSDNGVVAQDDHEPRVGTSPKVQWYPTTHWAANETVRDTFTLQLPAGLAPGAYSLRVGWYQSDTQDRLPVAGGADYVELGRLTLQP